MLEEVELILKGPMSREIQTISTERMRVGYVYFLTEDSRRALVVHNLFVNRWFRNQGLATEFIEQTFDLDVFDVRISVNIMNDIMHEKITTRYPVKPIARCLEYQIEYPSYVYCHGNVPSELI